jgi:hypothetical protein
MADGGYLVPNDLQGISACFSPGVSKEASFELAFANKGIQCYLADYSVNGPPFENQHFDFEKKYLGPENNQVFMTLERWVNEKQPIGAEFILQMDIEGAEFMMLQGAKQTLMNEPRPIWLMEISSSEHQPAGIVMNPRFAETFGVFFDHGYRVFTANSAANEITPAIVQEVVAGRRKFGTHNFVFR